MACWGMFFNISQRAHPHRCVNSTQSNAAVAEYVPRPDRYDSRLCSTARQEPLNRGNRPPGDAERESAHALDARDISFSPP